MRFQIRDFLHDSMNLLILPHIGPATQKLLRVCLGQPFYMVRFYIQYGNPISVPKRLLGKIVANSLIGAGDDDICHYATPISVKKF